MSCEHSFGGEERHLGVIGDGSPFSVGGGVVADSLFAIDADNFVQVQKFDGSAEGVADGAAEQASSEAVSYARIRRNPGKGHFSVEPRSDVFSLIGYCDFGKIRPIKWGVSGISRRELFPLLEGIHKGTVLRIGSR